VKVAAVVAAVLVAASPLQAQQPPDTLLAVPDTVVAAPDTVVAAPDTLLAAPDTLSDSLRVFVLPEVDGRAPVGVARGVWVFEREDLLAMRGISLADLLAQLPGVTRLRGGDYGAPETVTAFGLAGGGIRVFWEGFEQVPLDGAVTDLAHVGLGGVQRVRVERHPGELRVELTSLRDADPQPTSLVEAGTGDYDTNNFRGTFVHPRALGGGLGFALDRVDTNGRNREAGTRTGGWLRYTRGWGESFALTAEARRMKTTAAIEPYPGESTRTDWVVRARWRPVRGVVLHGFSGRSELEGRAREGTFALDRARRQHGVGIDMAGGPLRASGAVRVFNGTDLPSLSGDASLTLDLPVGGVTGATSQEQWDGATVGLVRVSAWTRPLLGLSLFGAWESGTRGVALHPPPPAIPDEPEPFVPEPDPIARFHERTATRLGASFGWRGLELYGARVSLEADSLPLLGLPMDEGGVIMDPIARTGVEVAGRIPIPFVPDGFALTGSATFWDEPARYLPERSYHAGLAFHGVFMPSGNLEVWGALGVEGRDPMIVPVADPQVPEEPVTTVPFYQSWYGFIQARVLTVRLYLAWDNFSIRRNNQDFPGRLLPITRATYGVRWTLFD
jgi:hypothetical protein